MLLLRFLASRVRQLAATGFSLVAVLVSTAEDTSSALDWVRAHAHPLRSIDPGQDLDDLQFLDALVQHARAVGLGEGTHTTHEFLTLRNRIFEYLVERQGFTAIATETHFLEAIAIDDYVQSSGPADPTMALWVASWTSPPVDENRQLIEWMRAYNARPGLKRPLHFYGIDMTGARSGAAYMHSRPRRGVDAALAYLDAVDVAAAATWRSRLEPMLARFDGHNYDDGSLSPADQAAFTAAITDLANVFARQRPLWISKSSALAFNRAQQHVKNGLWLDADFRSFGWGSTASVKGEISGRDAAMADNLLWAVDREGPHGRVLAFAHNGHIKHAPARREPDLAVVYTSMGQQLREALGKDWVTIATIEDRGEIGWAGRNLTKVGPAALESINGVMSQAGPPLFGLNLHELPDSGSSTQWWHGIQRLQNGATNYSRQDIAACYDGLIFVRTLTAMHTITPAPIAPVSSSAGTPADGQGAVPTPRIDALFAKYREPGRPGLAVGVYHRGQLVYERAYGLAELENEQPLTPGTVFNLGSLSKQFTACCVALLAREGKLDLDAEVRTYLPWFPNFGHRLTVNHLLHHTSGLREYMGLGELTGRGDDDLVRQAQVVNLLQRQRGLNFVPGSRFEYSNAGYLVLAEIVRQVSGQTVRAFATARLFEPLGMTHTLIRDNLTEVVPHYANAYEPAAKGRGWARAVYNRETIGPGNVLSTVGDLMRWARNFAHPLVGDAVLIQQLTTMGQLDDGTPINYGFGLGRGVIARHAAVLHSGSVPGFRSTLAYFPTDDFAVVILANHPVDRIPLIEKITLLCLGEGTVASTEPQATIPSPVLVAALAGSYQGPYTPCFTLSAKEGSIAWRSSSGPDSSPLYFWADGTFGRGKYTETRFKPVYDASGGVAALDEFGGLTGFGGPPTRHPRTTVAILTPAELQKLAGDYRGAELDTTFTLAVQGGHLVVRTLWMPESQALVPGGMDRFDSFGSGPFGRLSLQFRRNSSGKIVGVALNCSGVNALEADRL